MAAPRRMDRLTAQDLLMLWPDDFGWSEDIGVLAILDGTRLLDSDGRVRIDEVRRHIEPRLHLVPRFRQLLYRPRRGLGWPLWVDAPAFDLAEHVRIQPLAAPGDEAQPLAACAQLYQRRLDPTRPLWRAWLLPGLPDQQVGLLLHAHHTIADGVAGMAAFAALLDLDADAPTPVAPPWTPTPIPTAGELFRDNLHRRRQELGHGLSRLAHASRPWRASQRALREFFAERAPPHQPQPPHRRRPPAGGRPRAPRGRQAGRPHPPRQGQRRGPGGGGRRPAPAAGRPWRGPRWAGAAGDGADLAPPRAARAGQRQPGRDDAGAAAAGRARPGRSAGADRRRDGHTQAHGAPAGDQRALPLRRRPARHLPVPAPISGS